MAAIWSNKSLYIELIKKKSVQTETLKPPQGAFDQFTSFICT